MVAPIGSAASRGSLLVGGRPGLPRSPPRQATQRGDSAAGQPVRRVGVRLGRAARRRTGRSRVDHHARRAGQLPAALDVLAEAAGEHPLGDAGPAVRSTPPEPISRSTSRRSLPVRSTTRPSGLTTTRERGRRGGAGRGRRRRARSARRVGLGLVGGQVARAGRAAWLAYGREVGEAGGLDRRQGRPAHAEVALDGAGDGRDRDDLAGEARVLRVERDHAVDVGGGAADVDDHDVAGAGPLLVEAAGEQLDPGEHDVRRGAADHRAGSRRWR